MFAWQGIAHTCDRFHFVFSHFMKELLNIWGFYIELYLCSATSQTSMSAMLLLPGYEVVWDRVVISSGITLIQNLIRIHWAAPPYVTCMQTKLALYVCMCVCVYVAHILQRTCIKWLFECTWERSTWYTHYSIIYFTKFILDMFRTSTCSSSGGVLYKQLTVFRHTSSEESSRWHDTNDTGNQ